MTDTPTSDYSAQDLQALEGLEAVRKRPGMYIGSTDSRGLNHLGFEIVDNAVDEALAGHCTRITTIVHADGSVEVHDNGRGIPVDVNERTGLTGVELVFTKLHAGGKFGGGGYKTAGGLHGVGASVVNALSSRVDVEVDRDGKTHTISFQRGTPGVFDDNGDFTPGNGLRIVKGAKPTGTGTRVRYWPDHQIFLPEATIDIDIVHNRSRQTAFLVPGLELEVRDERGDEPAVELFRFDGGSADFVEYLAPDRPVCDPIVLTGTGTYTESVPVLDEATGSLVTQNVEREMEVDVAFRWGVGYETAIHSFVNIVATPKGGTHLNGFERSLTRTIQTAVGTYKVQKASDEAPIKDDCLEGLTAVVTVKMSEPQFEGQTKEILGTAAATKIVADVVAAGLTDWFAIKTNKAQGRTVLEKVAAAAKTRRELRLKKETIRRKSALESSSMPAKLADCRSDDLENTEILVVEGDSAMGCWVGSTPVALASGRTRTFEELADDWHNGISHFGYATDDEGDVRVVPLVHPRLTKRAAELVEVTLDNGEILRCTPDHLFRLRDGSYLRADKLTRGTSLMPLYRRFTEKGERPGRGYEMVWANGRDSWVHTHHLADKHNLAFGLDSRSNGPIRHHADFDKKNNDPRNIRRMTRTGHFQLHSRHSRELMLRLWSEPEFRSEMIAIRNDPARQELMSRVGREKWEDPEYRARHTEINRARTTTTEAIAGRVDGFMRWWESLGDEDRDEVLDRLMEQQEKYWAEPAHRAEQADRIRQYYTDNPEARDARRAEAIEQWSDAELRAWRSEQTKLQYSSQEARDAQADKVRAWHEKHPDFGEEHSARMKKRAAEGKLDVQIDALAAYRENTPSEVRAAKIRAGMKAKALVRVAAVLGHEDPAAEYDRVRRIESKTSPSWDKLVADYFDGDEAAMREAAKLVNHKVVSVRHLEERADVYDLTVDGYHNFALEAGVFVHNSAKAGRDSEYQALLPIRGKILNTYRATEKKMLDNAECAAIITALGAGSGKSFDIDSIRYGKFIILADADVDGAHIRTLLLTLVWRYMRPLLDAGRVYSAVPPLYRISVAGSGENIYAYSDEEREEHLADIEAAGKKVKEIQRYKGLGEMDAEQLAETTLDPAHRVLRRITVDDAEEAADAFEVCMGDAVAPRKDLIVSNALLIDRARLDI